MRRVEAGGGGHVAQAGEDLRELFNARGDGGSHACGVFNKNVQAIKRDALRSLLDGLDDGANGLFRRGITARAGMNDKKVGAERYGAHELVLKGLNRTRLEHRLNSSEVNQVVCVYDQRAQGKLGAARAKCGGIGVRNAGGATLPHAWAGRKNLQRIAAELASGFERVQVAAGDGSVNTNAKASVHPCGR